MSLGWLTDLTEGNSYFEEDRLESSSWDRLSDDSLKTRALKNAYNRLRYHKEYSIPASPTAAVLAKLKIAQCEMAYYLVGHLADEDRRKGLQAQGVEHAGIVKEIYNEDRLEKLPIPPFVDALMEDFKTAKAFGIVDIDRDEDEKASEDVVDL